MVVKRLIKTAFHVCLFLAFLILISHVLQMFPGGPLYAGDKDQCVWTGVERIVAVGDIHGDYQGFVTILKGTGLINDRQRWTGGKTHLVQLGDILDRGKRAKEVFDLIMRLEEEAEEAGGRVHMLIGDHEEMTLTGIAFGYPELVTVEQYVSFLPEDYRESREKKIREKYEDPNVDDLSSWTSLEEELWSFWTGEMKEDYAGDLYFRSFTDAYGKWMLKHNVVVKINDVVFVHGGISEQFSTWKLEDINKRTREELDHFRMAQKFKRSPVLQREIVYQPSGPLWYRDLASLPEEEFSEDVGRILENLGARSMVIGHTITQKRIRSRFEGRIWLIDTGISIYVEDGGHPSALVIENGKFKPVVLPKKKARYSVTDLPVCRIRLQDCKESFEFFLPPD